MRKRKSYRLTDDTLASLSVIQDRLQCRTITAALEYAVNQTADKMQRQARKEAKHGPTDPAPQQP